MATRRTARRGDCRNLRASLVFAASAGRGAPRTAGALLLAAWLLAACAQTTSQRAALHGTESPAGRTAQDLPSPPSPSADAPPPPSEAPHPSQGWTRYPGINEVHGLAWAPDGALWAATTGGVARWDVEAGTYDRFGAEDGLPSDYANGVAVAPDGSVWAAMLGGASHFAGKRWVTYTPADGVASSSVQSIAVGPLGDVWAGTLSGISRFDGRSWTSYLDGMRAWSLSVAPDGSVWAANDGAGVSRYSPADGEWLTYGTEQGLPAAGVKMVSVAPDGAVWIYVGYDRVYRHDGTRWSEVAGLSAPWVLSIAFDARGSAWVATGPGLHGGGYGLLRALGDAWEQVTTRQGLASDTVYAVSVGPQGTVAAGTTLGVSLSEEGHWRTLLGGPTRNKVAAVAVTPDGAVWLGFGDHAAYRSGGGVARFDQEGWSYFLDDQNVTVLSVDRHGTLWAGAGCSLYRWDGQIWSGARSSCDALMGDVVDLATGPDRSVWVASGLKLGRFDGESWMYYDRLASSVAVALDGAVWISAWKGTADSDYTARFDGTTWAEYPGRMGEMGVTPTGAVWAVQPGVGVVCFDGAAWSACDAPGETGLEISDCLTIGDDGSLWANGGAAPVRLDTEGWQVLPGAIACAPDRSLWLGTASGLVHWQPGAERP